MEGLNHDIVEAFDKFYHDYYHDDIGVLSGNYPQDQSSLWIDADDLWRYDQYLLDDWRENPDVMQKQAEAALAQHDIPVDIDLSGATVRLTDASAVMTRRSVTELSKDDIGSYVALTGQLGKITGKSPRLQAGAFECQRCGTVAKLPQTRTEVIEPHECSSCERQGPFQLRAKKSDWVDQRKIKLEEPIQERSQARGESTPVYVEGDLCDHGPADTTLPDHSGEQATVLGTVNVDESQLTGRNGDPETELWIDACAIVFEGDTHADVDIEAHQDTFEDIANQEDAVDIVAESLAPSLQASEGDDLYTARRAAAAWLFNAYRMDPDGGGSKRGDLHMCLIGDPGTGKSSLMSYLNKVAPKSEFRSGTGLSEVGLTAAAVQEEFAGTTEWTLQPGILPRADGGHCIIDEIDGVVDENTKAIHDALEGDQMVKTDKAGIKADLPTRAALLVGGNPSYTRFSRHEPIPEQIDIDPALFDRMDLVFALMDEVDEERDAAKAEHALEAYDDLSRAEVAQQQGNDPGEATIADPDVPADVLRAWVAYARDNVYPLLTDEAKSQLKDFYVDVRDLNDGHSTDRDDDPVPATMRTLEAGIRLSVSFARLRLSHDVKLRDVEQAIELTRDVVGLNFDPESGNFNVDRHTSGPTSQKERRKAVLDIIKEADGPLTMDQIKARAVERDINADKVESDMDHYRDKGAIYEPSTGEYNNT